MFTTIRAVDHHAACLVQKQKESPSRHDLRLDGLSFLLSPTLGYAPAERLGMAHAECGDAGG
ncbi:hypothetical protein GCM10010916_21610 [Paenibacillus abyssi]|uniref:Uncharacterized protein n=1 Tax=Paenibacillus abyssi TaxID=1340531 RepID=A0A917FV73_9BACL|nr:hypothetical protein GCM10010916_21610 [Paenibacillus abyssi]